MKKILFAASLICSMMIGSSSVSAQSTVNVNIPPDKYDLSFFSISASGVQAKFKFNVGAKDGSLSISSPSNLASFIKKNIKDDHVIKLTYPFELFALLTNSKGSLIQNFEGYFLKAYFRPGKHTIVVDGNSYGVEILSSSNEEFSVILSPELVKLIHQTLGKGKVSIKLGTHKISVGTKSFDVNLTANRDKNNDTAVITSITPKSVYRYAPEAENITMHGSNFGTSPSLIFFGLNGGEDLVRPAYVTPNKIVFSASTLLPDTYYAVVYPRGAYNTYKWKDHSNGLKFVVTDGDVRYTQDNYRYPQIKVIKPTQDEAVRAGKKIEIKWTGGNPNSNVVISAQWAGELGEQNGPEVRKIFTTKNDGVEKWTVPAAKKMSPGIYLIRIEQATRGSNGHVNIGTGFLKITE